jgi:CheY-like chemotaxis protein
MDRLSTSPSEERTPRAGREQFRILLADDNRPDIGLIRHAIHAYGISAAFDVVEDGEKAIELICRLENGPVEDLPSLILLDINMPRRSGLEVLARVRASQTLASIPVVIMTSSESEKDRNGVALLGASHYFCKPLAYEEFLKLGAIVYGLLTESDLHLAEPSRG